MLVNSAFFKNQSVTRRACLSDDLDRNISRMSLDSTVFLLFLGAEIYKIEVFKNLPFTKISTRKIRFFLACKNNSKLKVIRFLCELKPKVHHSKSVCGIFHFQFRLVFVKVYIFVQQKA